MQLSDTDRYFISTEQQPSTSQQNNEQIQNEDPDLADYNPGMSDNEVDSSGESYLLPS